MIGRALAHYRITAAIGAGGMGEVYRATDTKLGREVALKVLPAEMAASPERLERFRREAKALAAVDHPGVVGVFSVEEVGGVHFLTMQLVEGESLDRIIPGGGLPVDQILKIAFALAEALAAAHEKGIIHRDLKPANVMVTKDGRVKVLDFGLAKVAGSGDGAGTDSALPTEMRTREGVVMGTMPYMSPEQVQGQTLDHRTDIFSLGIILYEMASGERPFQGISPAGLASSILRDTPRPLVERRKDLPEGLGRLIDRCLEKNVRDRFPKARDVCDALGGVTAEAPQTRAAAVPASRPVPELPSGAARADEGFWVAVLPFKHRGSDPGLETLAEGLTEEIVTGLSRFSYLRVIARGSTARYATEAADVRAVGQELGARYVMEGSIRQAGSTLRIAAQLVDAISGAHLWAETYDRPFRPETIFELLDDVVPRIVSTVADAYGALPHTMSQAVRSKGSGQLTPYEALLRSFSYAARITAEEHAAAMAALELAVQQAPASADCWAQLSILLSDQHLHGFDGLPDPLGRAIHAARQAVDSGSSNHAAYEALAWALFLNKEFDASRNAAERTIALNPMDSHSAALMGQTIAYAGDWERGCALAKRAIDLNPNHPGWYRYALFLDAYRRNDSKAALAIALKMNMPGTPLVCVALAASYGQLGQREPGHTAVRELLALRPDYPAVAHRELGKLLDRVLVESVLEGLRKAGLDVPAATGAEPWAAPLAPGSSGGVAIAVLPFSDMSPAKDQEYLCEGMAEEIMNALVRVQGIRVASRTSAFRARQDGGDLAAIARALSVGHILEGSVRTAGSRLRVTAQLTDVASGYQLWSERFDREAADVFAIQDEIAAGVVDAVKARLAPGTRSIHARPPARNLEAYRTYLKGRHLRGKEDHAGALCAFEEAVRLDPSHAPSWTGLAEITVLAAHFGAIPPREACAAARRALATAMELQGESAEGLHVEAFAAFIERRWDAMETAWRRALEFQPDHVLALGSFGISLCARQKLDLALPLFERAREADPLASFPYTLTGWGLLVVGRPQEALRYVEDALTFEKEDASAVCASCLAQVALGRLEEGVAAGEHGVAVSRRGAFFLGVLGWALATAGRNGEARTVLQELRARPAASPTAVSEAWLLGALGEIDDAFDLLARAEEEYQGLLCYTGLPGFDPLRADPRFAALLRRLELSPA